MKNYLLIVCALCAALSPPNSHCQEHSDLIHLQSAFTAKKGDLALFSHTFAFFKHARYQYPNAQSRSVTYWDIQGGIAAKYGATDFLEFTLLQLLYQDNHKDAPGYNLPDDLFFSVTLGNFGPRDFPFRAGGTVQMRFPLADYHNIVLEPYSAGRIEFAASVLFSYCSRPNDYRNNYRLHLNIGIHNHNDVGKSLTGIAEDTATADVATRQLLFGFAYTKKAFPFCFSLEFSGNSLPQQPPVSAYSRENFLYFTPSVTYELNPHLALTTGVDIRLIDSSDETEYTSSLPQHNFDNYPSWRLYLRARFSVRPRFEVFREPLAPPLPEKISQPEQVNNRTLQLLVKDKKTTETAEAELARIQEERERVARILEKLKRMIDTKKTKPPPRI